MRYIKSTDLDKIDDNFIVYVNRNVLNSTLANYEINMEYCENDDKLQTLLAMWNEIYENEKKNKRIELFVKMKNRDIKSCFRNYKELPLGTFGVPAEVEIKRG